MSGQVHRLLKHERIVDELAREIEVGRLAPGAQLPGEHTLASKYEVSRNTVRQALTELAKRGMIATHAGRGSFVTYDGRPLDDRLGWAHAMSEHGFETRTRVLRIELVTDAALAEQHELASAEMIAVDRLRMVAGGPAISLERSRVPAVGELRELPANGLQESLYTVLRTAGLVPAQGEEWVGLATLTAAEARLLARDEGESFLRVRRISRDIEKRFVEYVDSLLDPAHFELHMRFGYDL